MMYRPLIFLTFSNDVVLTQKKICWHQTKAPNPIFYLPNQVELLIRLQTQRARDSEFNTTSVIIISQPPEEQAHQQQQKKLNSDTVEGWATTWPAMSFTFPVRILDSFFLNIYFHGKLKMFGCINNRSLCVRTKALEKKGFWHSSNRNNGNKRTITKRPMLHSVHVFSLSFIFTKALYYHYVYVSLV